MKIKQTNQSAGELAAQLMGNNALRVCREATCYDIVRRGGNKCLVPTINTVTEDKTFSVSSLFSALLGQTEVLVARVTFPANGKESPDRLILTTAIEKPSFSHGY